MPLLVFPFVSKEQGKKECSPYWQQAEWYLFFGMEKEPAERPCPALVSPVDVQTLSLCHRNCATPAFQLLFFFLSFQGSNTPSLFPPHYLILLHLNPPKNHLCSYSSFPSPLEGCFDARCVYMHCGWQEGSWAPPPRKPQTIRAVQFPVHRYQGLLK